MYRYLITIILCTLGGYASAHQFTPTYPKLVPSLVPGVFKADMKIFNKREDVEFFVFSVYDENWKSVPSATSSRYLRVPYLATKNVEIYVRQGDADQVTYICSKSKILKEEAQQFAAVSSRICSKVK